MTNTTKVILIAAFFVLFLWTSGLNATMTGGDYVIIEDGFSIFESVTSTGGSYELWDFGDFTPATSTGGNFELHGGFYFPDGTGLSLIVSPTSIDLGTLSLSQVSSDSLNLTVTSDSLNGYTVSISEVGNLRSVANDVINDVADGAVTAGSEEYGISTSGTAGQLSNDKAIDGSVNVAVYNNSVTSQVTAVVFKASIGPLSQAGSYSHSVTFSASVNP